MAKEERVNLSDSSIKELARALHYGERATKISNPLDNELSARRALFTFGESDAKALKSAINNIIEGTKGLTEISNSARAEITSLQHDLTVDKAYMDALKDRHKELEALKASLEKSGESTLMVEHQLIALSAEIDKYHSKIGKEKLALTLQQSKKAVADERLYEINRSKIREELKDKVEIPLPASLEGLLDKIAKNQADKERDLERIKELEEARDRGDTLSADEEEELQEKKQSVRNQEKQEEALNKLVSLGNKMLAKLNESVDAAMRTMGQYLGPMSARLQDSGQDFHSIRETLESTLTGSPYVSQKKLLENVSKLVEAGIAYNLEQRALLVTLADRMVSSFDALDASLTRLTRLQRADLTTSSMGVEAQILRFLNENFKDNSYLNDAYDAVSAALLEAMSQLPYESTSGFAFNLQKWLGALYSIGLSSEAVSTIAQGVGYLGSGNVTALTGNTQMQTLLAMSAAKAGVSYSEMLTKGIDETEINKLMKAMVEYLQDIASNTEENKVVRAAYGNVFGNLSVSDIRAISNLSQASIENIFNSSMNYESALRSTNYQLAQIKSRTTIQEKIDNAIENTLTTFGYEIAENAGLYLTWRIGDVLVDLGSSIPTIGKYVQIAGAVAKAAVGLKGVVSTITKLFDSWDNGMGVEGGFAWSRTIEGVSSSYGVSGLAGSSYSANSVQSHDAIAAEVKESKRDVEGVEEAIGRDVDDIYRKLFEDKEAIRVLMDEKNQQNQEAVQQVLDEIKGAISTLTGDSGAIKTSTAAIKSKLDGKIQVDVVDNDVSAITGAIYSMRNAGGNSPFIRP